MQHQNFSKIFQKFKKTFFEFFSSIPWGLCTGTKCEKVVLFGFSTGPKGEFRIFDE
jgi:hypothetical protein